MVDNSIDTLKRETWAAPSKVAFRNLGTPGNNVAVKYLQGSLTFNDKYEWTLNGHLITEHQARELLSALTKRQEAEESLKKEPSLYRWADGHVMQRETARIYLPQNNGLGTDTMGKWVLRDKAGIALDIDRDHSVLMDRHQDTIGDPLEEVTYSEGRTFIKL